VHGDIRAFLLETLLPVIGLLSFFTKVPTLLIALIPVNVETDSISLVLEDVGEKRLPTDALFYIPLAALLAPTLAVCGLNFFKCFVITTPF
jgi:hypothetical protein